MDQFTVQSAKKSSNTMQSFQLAPQVANRFVFLRTSLPQQGKRKLEVDVPDLAASSSLLNWT